MNGWGDQLRLSLAVFFLWLPCPHFACGQQPAAAAGTPTAKTVAKSILPNDIQELQTRLTADLREKLAAFGAIDDTETSAVIRYSQRGDLRMFLGDFNGAVDDYQKMVALDPSVDTSHWRLGIALFFADKPGQAAAQFDKYHAFDDVDRENGIWRFLSHYQAFGPEKAQEELLRYEKDDRPPFPEVYRLFEGSLTADQVLASIPKGLDATSTASRRFYADLYIGLHHYVQKQPQQAEQFLLQAVRNTWPKTAGFGPNYMWHVGRLQYLRIAESDPSPVSAPAKTP